MTDAVINRTPKKPETNGLGLAGFIVSLVGICSGGVLSPIGLVLSIVGLFREPRGFAIAGDDGRFVWANAQIEGDTVVVWSDDISTPVAVRYAWGDNPDRANLYNAEGLPAASFRTDAP